MHNTIHVHVHVLNVIDNWFGKLKGKREDEGERVEKLGGRRRIMEEGREGERGRKTERMTEAE